MAGMKRILNQDGNSAGIDVCYDNVRAGVTVDGPQGKIPGIIADRVIS